ncbi:Scramblase-domain-containing protein [Aspergillus uvarum CBS 121591]|uniref:Scramblase-domain-containing protein n=1 Tax=Aspergillus uvarum CBS 121591 TaxID=1448315 RepID=A0A319C3U5_9EURO|nr:Scramblase-domain-containing protein [Aspergillus uvarum CBS 121591]PYH78550.1 Scramblase-domain-containing protein [Aspergillus uvarum CBS 121591]
MWSAILRPSHARCFRTPGRAFASSLNRGRVNPRGPRNSIRRPEPLRRDVPSSQSTDPQQQQQQQPPSDSPNPHYDPSQNTLLAPVHIPEDPHGVIKESHPATSILANSGLVVQRQLELMNVLIGFEQANKYVVMDANGNHIGFMAEQEKGMGNMMARQWFNTHRSFVTHVFDKHENEVLRFHRPFSWINSRIRVYDPLEVAKSAHSTSTALQTNPANSLAQASGDSNARLSSLGFEDMRVIGEAQQQWAPLRRKYNLFTYHHSPNSALDMGTKTLPLEQSDLSSSQQMQLVQSSQGGQATGAYNQFAYVDEPFLSWDFALRSADSRLIGSVNRNFAGFAREFFTDTGVYALRMDSASPSEQTPEQSRAVTAMSLDQRAVMLATAVSIDFDYFSRHSGAGGFGFMPLWFPGFGGEAAAGGAAAGGAAAGGAVAGEAGAAGAAGAVGEAAAGTVGRAGAGAAGGLADGAMAGAAGAGAMAGYDAMSRGMGGTSPASPPDSQAASGGQQPPAQGQTGPYGDVWADEQQEKPADHREDPWADEEDDGGDGGDGDSWDFF